MDARDVDQAADRLRELRHEGWADLALAALTLGLSFVASATFPALVVPLFIGGLVVGATGMAALLCRSDLRDRLSGDRDAYVIPEVRDYALRQASMETRRRLATYIRLRLEEPRGGRVASAEGELEALVRELNDDGLSLDPACAVACMRLVSDMEQSPLLNPALPAEDVRSHVRQIRSGFERRPITS